MTLVLPANCAPERASATSTCPAPVPAVQPRKNTPGNGKPLPTPVRRVREREFVNAIDRWLGGEAWACADAAFRPFHGINVRLVEAGDVLTAEGVAIVSRKPASLCKLPSGTRTANRLEARALAAVAVRGDAGMYGGNAA